MIENIAENEIEEILTRRIHDNLSRYFPDCDAGTVTVRLLPNKYRTTNPIYLFEIRGAAGKYQKKIIAKKLLLRITAPDAPQREYEMLSKFYANKLMVDKRFLVPRPLDFYPDIRVLITEYVEGIKLLRVIKKKNTLFSLSSRMKLNQLIYRCGRCLWTIHQVNKTEQATTIENEKIYLDLYANMEKNYQSLVDHHIMHDCDHSLFKKTIDRSIRLMKGVQIPLVIAHGDFGFSNLIISGDNIYIIDFAFSRETLPFVDIGGFLFCFETVNPFPGNFFYDFRNTETLQKSFIEGYYKNMGDVQMTDQILISLYKLRGMILHCKNRYERQASKNWRGQLYFFLLKNIYRRKIGNELSVLNNYIEKREQTVA